MLCKRAFSVSMASSISCSSFFSVRCWASYFAVEASKLSIIPESCEKLTWLTSRVSRYLSRPFKHFLVRSNAWSTSSFFASKPTRVSEVVGGWTFSAYEIDTSWISPWPHPSTLKLFKLYDLTMPRTTKAHRRVELSMDSGRPDITNLLAPGEARKAYTRVICALPK